MDPEYLSDLVLGTGVVVTLVASFLAAPAATRHLSGRVSETAVGGWTATWSLAARLWVRLSRRNRGTIVAALPSVTFSVRSNASGSVSTTWNVRADKDAETRIAWLEAKVMQLKKMSDDNEQAVTVERTAREGDVRRLDQRITDEAAAIRAGISAREEAARRGDASVLPVLGLGVVLTATPDVLAHATWLGSPVLAGVLGIVAGLAALQGALMHFWRSAQQVETA